MTRREPGGISHTEVNHMKQTFDAQKRISHTDDTLAKEINDAENQ